MMKYFHGTLSLTKLYLRQNRIFTLIWLLLPGVWLAINTISSLVLFPTQEALVEMGVSLIDPLTEAIHGPLLDISVAGFVTCRTKVFLVLLGGIFSVVHMIRHTRLAEEQGKRELLDANVTGSLATLTAALVNMIIINSIAAVLAVFTMVALGLGFAGSLAHCPGFFASSCVLGILAGVAAQFFVSATAGLFPSERAGLSQSRGFVILVPLLGARKRACFSHGFAFTESFPSRSAVPVT
ncbi:hypothetical protein ABFV83_08110 [Lacrimispora sp. BS-2]|uniref:Uncharacterized protein n=1 Tax=Lacrimispora sp. BS-2 TaxID=3151850 RepID=A0AAU7PUP6_9FIRM